MCIVIDANIFSSIAYEGASAHSELKPLLKWISFGRGKVVYGGTKYGEEIAKHSKFGQWLKELEKKRKVVHIDDTRIDSTMDYLMNNVSGPDYDDHHILAIVFVSGCKLVCSSDKGLHSLVHVCYEPRLKTLIKRDCPCAGNPSRPKIYQNSDHKDLLCDENVASCCQ